MNNKAVTSFAAIVVLLVLGGPMFAHHGSSVSYDMTKPITLKGTIKEFVFANPHCQIYFDVKDEEGNVVQWGGETMAPRLVVKLGLTKNTLKPGDQVTVTVFPSKAGRNFGLVRTIELPSGQTLSLISPEDAASRGEIGNQAGAKQ